MTTQSTTTLNPKAKPLAERISALAEKCGVHVSWHMGGVHPYALLEKDGVSRKHVIAGTPGDHRGEENNLSDLRRLFRSVGWFILDENIQESTYAATTVNALPPKDYAPPRKVTPDEEQVPAKQTPPPLSDPRAIHVNGWEVPHIPDIAKGKATPGRKSQEYIDFLVHRDHWVSVVMRSGPGGNMENILDALSRAGHETTEKALRKRIQMRAAGERVSNTVKARVGNVSTETIKEKLMEMVDSLVAKKLAIVSAERDELLEKLIETEEERDEAVQKLQNFKKLLSNV